MIRSVRTAAVLVALLAGACASPTSDGAAPPAGQTADAQVPGPSAPTGAFSGTVTHISDGDTLWLRVDDPGDSRLPRSEEVKFRLLRIDTPELARDGQPAECLADAAADALADLVPEGTTVVGSHDVEEQDRFGRDLAHLWTLDGTWVNGWMLQQGYASVVTFPPNTAFDDEVRRLERDAREAERGLWDASVC